MGASLPYPETWLAPPAGPALVVAPHPDDETIGCGGVIALQRRRGDAVHVVVASDGERGDPDGRYPGGAAYVELRRNECRQAARVLDVPPPVFLGFADQAIDAAALERELDAILASLRPAALYHPVVPEMHPDHHVVGAAVLRAAARCGHALRTFAYETWVPVVPTHVIDVGPVWDVKQRALACYPSQLAYNDYSRVVAGLAAYRTIYVPRADHVEAFAETTPPRSRRRWPLTHVLPRRRR